MLDRLHAIRSVAGKAAIGAVLASSLAVAACGGTTSGTTSTNANLTACQIRSSDLVPSVSTSGSATKVAGVSGKLAIDGSTALAPLFTAAAGEFDQANGTQSTVTPNGSGTGLKDAAAGAVQIGMSDVFALEKEPTPGAYSSLTDHQVAAVIFSLVVNNDLQGKVDNLTSDEINQVFTGKVTNWSQIGGPNEAVTVINRPTSSGTRATFKKYVLNGTEPSSGTTLTEDTTGAVTTAVAGTKGAIGYVSLSFVNSAKDQVSPICIDGFKAVATDVNAGNYKFWSIEHAYTKDPAAGAAKALIQYVQSDQIQKNDLLKLNYLPLTTVAPTAIQAHTPTGAPQPETLGS
jgi:phosphate transport system substrate-binding protein